MDFDISHMPLDEMSIVDVLTKLIFDAESELDESESLIVSMLGQVDSSMVDVPRREISECLRAMAVDEMIRIVDKLKLIIEQQQKLIIAGQQSSVIPLHR